MKFIATLAASSFFLNLAADCASSPQDCFPVTHQCALETFKPNDVTYELYGDCLYLQPNGTNLYYGAQAVGINPNLPSPASVASPNWTILKIDPDYHFGFEVGASVLFNNSNIDIGVNWE